MKRDDDHGLEFLLAFDGRVHHLERGYWIKFEIRRVEPNEKRPHGLVYSFTLHGPDGARLIGFDNAHRVGGASSSKGRQAASDHWHRAEKTRDDPIDSGAPRHCSTTSLTRLSAFCASAGSERRR